MTSQRVHPLAGINSPPQRAAIFPWTDSYYGRPPAALGGSPHQAAGDHAPWAGHGL